MRFKVLSGPRVSQTWVGIEAVALALPGTRSLSRMRRGQFGAAAAERFLLRS